MDLNGGQALGISQALAQVFPAFWTPENALTNVAIACTIHLGWNVVQMGLSSFCHQLMLGLPNV